LVEGARRGVERKLRERDALGLEDGLQGVAFDEFAFSSSSSAESVVSDAVDVAEAAGSGFVEDGDGVGGEEFLVAADGGEANTDVVGGVFGRERSDGQSVVDAGVQGAVSATRKAVFEIRQADEDEGKERSAVPRIVEQDVKVIEGVLMEQMGFVDEEDWENAVV
jgi:hypothetical protein